MMNQLRTVFFLSSLTALLMLMGYFIGGETGVFFAFVLSLAMNFYSYFNSHKFVLSSQNAQPLSKEKYPQLHAMVEELADEYQIPVPKLWYVPTRVANAFATGRNPKNGHVAVTQGIMDILEPHELRGVLAHELGHIKNRDILVSSVAVTISGAIGMLANSIRWGAYADGNRRGGGLGVLFIAILMPIAATLLQLGISRSREYMADESGAHCSRDPLALASALRKLDASARQHQLTPRTPAEAITSSLYIVYPFTGLKLSHLLSTHPPMEERIARLERMSV